MYLVILMFLFSIQLMAGVADPAIIWPKKMVSVCWQNDIPLSEDLFTPSQWAKLDTTSPDLISPSLDWKKKIQTAIDSEFTLSEAGITFVGWNSCDISPNADAVIIVAKSSELPLGRASVGRSEYIFGEERRTILPEGKKAFVFINMVEVTNSSLTYEEEILYTAIHEFGHLAGLNHENTQPQASVDPNCTEYDLYREPGQDFFQYLTAYDANSIMNYCFYNFISKSSLSFKAEINGIISNDFSFNVFPFLNFAIYTDPLIFEINPLNEKLLNVGVRLGLSSMDLKALNLLYIDR